MSASAVSYVRDPEEIYRESFATIRREAELSRFAPQEEAVAVRMIHACGMIDLVDDLVIASGAIEAGQASIAGGRPIVCDVEMVRRGIIRRLLPDDLRVLCNIASNETAARATSLGTTRSAAALDGLAVEIAGSIAVIGNAPTALFHLLEMINEGCEPPALIIGIPVGFVGAVESKEALVASDCGIPYITVRGRRGGSAIAAAALNGIAGGLGR